jgi:hypothetical protein
MVRSPSDLSDQPDAWEELRRQRGEGWQWSRIQSDPCPQCGDHPAALPPAALGELAVTRAASWRVFLLQADDGYLRTCPAVAVFSPLQYAAHVRDILRVYTERMVLGREEDNPTVPMFNPPHQEFVRYNGLGAGELAMDLADQAQRLRQTAEAMDSDAWSRCVINDRGVYGVYTFTLAGLACNAVHEAHHHLLDAKGTLNAPDEERGARR